MTTIILAGSADLAPLMETWGQAADDVVVFTARPPVLDGDVVPPAVDVRYVGDYADSATVDLNVVALARRKPITAIVAADQADLIRAGALRDYLGIPGQGRDSAVTFRDLVAMRRVLAQAQVPVLPCRPVRRAMDIFHAAAQLGLPLRVRRRRAAGWPVAGLLDTPGALREFTSDGLGVGAGEAASLLAESPVDRGRHTFVCEPDDGDVAAAARLDLAAPADVAALARAALAALPAAAGQAYAVEVITTVDGRLLVDSVAEVTPRPERPACARDMTQKVHS